MELNLKFRMARLLINHSQVQASKMSGLSQRDISQIENGKRTFIPTAYIQYLHNEELDMNSIFGSSDEVHFRVAKSNNTSKMTKEGYVPKAIRVGLTKTEYKLLENDNLSQLADVLATIVDRPSFNLCQRKNCIHNLSKSSKCIDISNGTCIVIEGNSK